MDTKKDKEHQIVDIGSHWTNFEVPIDKDLLDIFWNILKFMD